MQSWTDSCFYSYSIGLWPSALYVGEVYRDIHLAFVLPGNAFMLDKVHTRVPCMQEIRYFTRTSIRLSLYFHPLVSW